MPGSASRTLLNQSDLWRRALVGAAWLLLVVYFYSPVREVMNPSLDSSNYASYAYFTANGFRYGAEVMPMAGPFGFVMYGWTYSGHLFALRTALELILNGALAALTLWFFIQHRGSPWRWVWLAAHVAYTPFLEDLPIEWILVLGGLFLLRQSPSSNQLSWDVAVTALLAFLSLIKGTQFVLGLATVGVVLAGLAGLGQWRKVALVAAGFLASVVLFWMLGGQAMQDIPAYVRSSLELSSGYNDAMSLEEPTSIFLRGVLITLLIGLSIVWSAWSHRRNVPILAGLAILAGHTFVQWKHGFVRADGHALIYFHYAIVAAALISLWTRKIESTPSYRSIPAVIAAAVILISGSSGILVPAWNKIPTEFGARFSTHFAQLRDLPGTKAKYDKALADEAKLHAMPLTRHEVKQSSIDLFGFEHGLITLNGLNYRPRPMGGGSFNAYTPRIMQANRDYLRDSATRPEYYLLRIQTIDDRLASQDDGLAMFDLLYLYRPILSEHAHLLLKALPDARVPEPRKIADQSFQIGDTITVPIVAKDELLIARFDVSLSILGHLRNFFYKVPRTRLALLGEGIEQQAIHRLVPSMAKSPFVLAPVIETNRDWLQLFGETPGKTLKQFRLSTSDRTWFRRTARVEFFAAPRPEALADETLTQLRSFTESGLETVDTVDAQSGNTTKVISQLVHPPASLRWSLDRDVTQVTFDFGLVPAAYQDGESDGVEFSVTLVRPDKSPVLLFQRMLAPLQRSTDQGNQKAVLDLPFLQEGSSLQISTNEGPHNDGSWDWAYIANLELHRRKHSEAQFPNFNRFPSDMKAEFGTVVNTDFGNVLMVHAPAELTFSLCPSDRVLEFDFGFLPSAYSGEGTTEGTDYVVEVRRSDGTVSEIFRRSLRPMADPADRGTQTALIPLKEINEGDKLQLSTTPGPTGRVDWAWAYISQVKFR
jgi:hypothetical protein